VLLAAQPELVTAVLQVVQLVLARHLLDQAGLASDEGRGGVVMLIQRFGSAANSCQPIAACLCSGWQATIRSTMRRAMPGYC
jgi:hypothetical protein